MFFREPSLQFISRGGREGSEWRGGGMRLDVFFSIEKGKLNLSGSNVFLKMFSHFSVSPEHSDLATSQGCAR